LFERKETQIKTGGVWEQKKRNKKG